LLEHEHKYLDHDDEDNDDMAEQKAATRLTIDRLAARVLDFDLRYVLKRTEPEEGERKTGRD
jgi:DNA-binding FrmR family transcriptional regulator